MRCFPKGYVRAIRMRRTCAMIDDRLAARETLQMPWHCPARRTPITHRPDEAAHARMPFVSAHSERRALSPRSGAFPARLYLNGCVSVTGATPLRPPKERPVTNRDSFPVHLVPKLDRRQQPDRRAVWRGSRRAADQPRRCACRSATQQLLPLNSLSDPSGGGEVNRTSGIIDR